jgi:hypothetical protein
MGIRLQTKEMLVEVVTVTRTKRSVKERCEVVMLTWNQNVENECSRCLWSLGGSTGGYCLRLL